MTQKEIKNTIKQKGYILSFAKNNTYVYEPYVSKVTGKVKMIYVSFSTKKYDWKFLENNIRYL